LAILPSLPLDQCQWLIKLLPVLKTTNQEFTLNDMLLDVAEVAGYCNFNQFTLLGISMGGLISQRFAIEFPEKVRGLVLVSTTPSLGRIAAEEQPWVADLDAIVEKLSLYVAPGFFRANHSLIQAMGKNILTAIKDGTFLVGAAAQREAVSGFDVSDELHKIEAATLVIHGEIDRVVPFSMGIELSKKIRNSQLIGVPDVGHLILAEAPKKLYDATLAFVDERDFA